MDDKYVLQITNAKDLPDTSNFKTINTDTIDGKKHRSDNSFYTKGEKIIFNFFRLITIQHNGKCIAVGKIMIDYLTFEDQNE